MKRLGQPRRFRLRSLNLFRSLETMAIKVSNHDIFGDGNMLNVVLQNAKDVGLGLCKSKVSHNENVIGTAIVQRTMNE